MIYYILRVVSFKLLKNHRVSILLPTFNGQSTIRATLLSIFKQTYKDFEIVISDDDSSDATLNIVKGFEDERIVMCKNSGIRGYPQNLRSAFLNSSGELIFLMGQDDLLTPTAIQLAVSAVDKSDVGAVSRSYFWFGDNPSDVIRVKLPLELGISTKVNAKSNPRQLAKIFGTADQLSGLLIKRKFVEQFPFNDDIFPCHVYPFAAAVLSEGAICLGEMTVGVRSSTSQSRHLSSIYNNSPVGSWSRWADSMFGAYNLTTLGKIVVRELIKDQWPGLLQIANFSFGGRVSAFREYLKTIAVWPRLILHIRLNLMLIYVLITPKSIRVTQTDRLKRFFIGKNRKHLVNEKVIQSLQVYEELHKEMID
jgi:glycosyltransferase involved in cell wall biosynthesis